MSQRVRRDPGFSGKIALVSLCLGVALILGGITCGPAAPVCGNNIIEKGEQCDDGPLNGTPDDPCTIDCRSISIPMPQVAVSWSLLSNTCVPGYSGAGCSDFQATQARVELSGPSSSDEIIACSTYGKLYASICTPGVDAGDKCPHLLPGTYQVAVTILDADGTPLTKRLTSASADVQAGAAVPLKINFGMSDFLKQDYTGTLYFLASWGQQGATCSNVAHPVTQEILTLIREGSTTPVSNLTTDGRKLDGTSSTCFTPDTSTKVHEQVDTLRWGKYNLTISSDDHYFENTFPIFVGPTKYGPTFNLLVPHGLSIVDGGADGAGCEP